MSHTNTRIDKSIKNNDEIPNSNSIKAIKQTEKLKKKKTKGYKDVELLRRDLKL